MADTPDPLGPPEQPPADPEVKLLLVDDLPANLLALPAALRAKVAVFVGLFEQARHARRQAEQLRLLVEGTHDHALFLLGPHGHVRTWNAGAQRLKGYSAEEVLGRHFALFYPPEDVR